MIKTKLLELCKLYKKDLIACQYMNFGKYYELRARNNKLYKVTENSYSGIRETKLNDQDLSIHKEELLENYTNAMRNLK